MQEEKGLENPLVSIIVITYNSSKYVLETLESAKAQTYDNIELIVSDDCSTDNTVEICKQWLNQNKERFKWTELVSSDKNTGIPANCNRGVKAAKGEWLKLVAGDDLLIDDAISMIVEFINRNSCDVIVTKYKYFYDDNDSRIFEKIYPGDELGEKFFNKSTLEQYELLLKERYPLILGLFFSIKMFNSVGGYNEKYKLIEDLPFLINISRSGFKYFYLPKVTLLYRKHINSISRSRTEELPFTPRFIQTDYLIYRDIIRSNISFWDRMYHDFKYGGYNFLIKNNIKSKLIIKIVLLTPIYLTPKFYINKIKMLTLNNK